MVPIILQIICPSKVLNTRYALSGTFYPLETCNAILGCTLFWLLHSFPYNQSYRHIFPSLLGFYKPWKLILHCTDHVSMQ